MEDNVRTTPPPSATDFRLVVVPRQHFEGTTTRGRLSATDMDPHRRQPIRPASAAPAFPFQGWVDGAWGSQGGVPCLRH